MYLYWKFPFLEFQFMYSLIMKKVFKMKFAFTVQYAYFICIYKIICYLTDFNRSNTIQVLYLRKFQALKSVTLSGNPFSSSDEYRPYVIAFLPHLEYLDYKLVDPALVFSPSCIFS